MKKVILVIVSAALTLSSCGGKKADKSSLLGVWNLEEIDFPLYEDDYKARLNSNDTMKHLDVGKAIYWGTNNVDSIRLLERGLIEKEHEFMLSEFKKFSLNFVSDSLVVKTTNMFVDSLNWVITPNQELVLNSIIETNKRPDTMNITYFNSKKIEFSERFMKSQVKSTYLKK